MRLEGVGDQSDSAGSEWVKIVQMALCTVKYMLTPRMTLIFYIFDAGIVVGNNTLSS